MEKIYFPVFQDMAYVTLTASEFSRKIIIWIWCRYKSVKKKNKSHFKIVLKQALNSVAQEYLTLKLQDGDKISRTKLYKDYRTKKYCLNNPSLNLSNCKTLELF